MKEIKKLAVETYRKFAKKEGSDYIASEHALKCILENIVDFKVGSVLEVGLGIGTIPSLVKEAEKRGILKKNIFYVGTEANQFCLDALKYNLGENYDSIQIFSSLDSMNEERTFDLVVIDGGGDEVKRIKPYIHKGTILMIEGDRQNQQKIIRDSIGTNFLFYRDISIERAPDYAPHTHLNQWKGGISVFYIEPTFKEKCKYFYKKILTALKYRYRKIYK